MGRREDRGELPTKRNQEQSDSRPTYRGEVGSASSSKELLSKYPLSEQPFLSYLHWDFQRLSLGLPSGQQGIGQMKQGRDSHWRGKGSRGTDTLPPYLCLIPRSPSFRANCQPLAPLSSHKALLASFLYSPTALSGLSGERTHHNLPWIKITHVCCVSPLSCQPENRGFDLPFRFIQPQHRSIIINTPNYKMLIACHSDVLQTLFLAL